MTERKNKWQMNEFKTKGFEKLKTHQGSDLKLIIISNEITLQLKDRLFSVDLLSLIKCWLHEA